MKGEEKNCQKRRWHSNHHPPSQCLARGDYRCILDIRGIILLVLDKIRLENERYGGRAQDLRILQVLQDLSVHYVDRFPFLLYFIGFRNECKLLEDAHNVKHNFVDSYQRDSRRVKISSSYPCRWELFEILALLFTTNFTKASQDAISIFFHNRSAFCRMYWALLDFWLRREMDQYFVL